MKIFRKLAALVSVAALLLTGCGANDDPFETGSSTDAITVGSSAYYSNEILAEIFSQALEAEGFEVNRRFNIGKRDAYLPSLQNGDITLFAEYTGNLLQALEPDTTVTEPQAVYDELVKALPDNLVAYDRAPAADQDSYNVTAEFAEKNQVKTIADLAKIGKVRVGGKPELEGRPYGPQGLRSVYGLDVEFVATGETTPEELAAGNVDVANIFSAEPRIKTYNLVTLEDPEGMFLASNVVPIVQAEKADELRGIIEPIAKKLTTEDLVNMNLASTRDKRSSADIAKEWLRSINK